MKNTLVVAGLLVSLAVTSAGNAANILFVHDLNASGDGTVAANVAADTAMINQLNSLGHTVSLVDDSAVTAAAIAAAGVASASDFIVLSSTASSNPFALNNSGDGNHGAANSLATSATIVLMEGGNNVLFAFNLQTGGGLGTKVGTSINVIADDGYVTAGLPIGSLTIYNAPSNIGTFGVVPPQGAGIGFGSYDFLGTSLASVPDGSLPINDVTVGTRVRGDNLIVVLPFHNGSFTNVNANGTKLFNNVFGVAVPEPGSIVILLGGLGTLGALRQRRPA